MVDVSRRMVVGGGIAAIGAFLLDSHPARAHASSAAGTTVPATVATLDTPAEALEVLRFYDRPFVTQYVEETYRTVRLNGLMKDDSGSSIVDIALLSSPSLYNPTSTAVVVRDGTATPVEVATATGAAETVQTWTLDASDARGAEIDMVLPINVRELGTSDNIGPQRPLEIVISRGNETVGTWFLSSRQTINSVYPWSAGLSAGWLEPEDASTGRTYRLPSTVVLEAAGPGSIPPGQSLEISFDSRACKGASVFSPTEGVEWELVPLAGPLVTTLVIRLLNGIEVGASISVQIAYDREATAPTASFSRSSVHLAPAEGARTPFRAVLPTSLADVTQSGRAQSASSTTIFGG